MARARRARTAVTGAGCSTSSNAARSSSAREELVLDTNASLEAAGGLYRSSGYVDIEPYNANPNATNWYGKRVG